MILYGIGCCDMKLENIDHSGASTSSPASPSLPLPLPPLTHTHIYLSGVLHACEIADINCLKVANESTLIALSYGIFKSAKKLFSETDPAHVMFIDIGYTVSDTGSKSNILHCESLSLKMINT